jgi:hypothetical protein
MREDFSTRQVPGQLGVAAATVAMVAAVVGLAQIHTGAGTPADGAAALAPPATSAPSASVPSPLMPGAPSNGTAPATQNPGTTTTVPGPSVQGQPVPQPGETPTVPPSPSRDGAPGPTSTAGQTPSSAPAPPPSAPAPATQPPPATPDALTVQRVTDSCSRRLQSDAANSGVVTGTVVPRPYSLVSVEFVGAPQRSTAGSGLESYDVHLSVVTQPVDGPAQTDRRVCRVYDYDSHVDWLPAG